MECRAAAADTPIAEQEGLSRELAAAAQGQARLAESLLLEGGGLQSKKLAVQPLAKGEQRGLMASRTRAHLVGV